jgi:small subunit ribosomal protein S20
LANNPSAKKRARQAVKRTAINKSRISRVRTFVRKVEDAIGRGDAEAAQAALARAEPEMRRGVTKGVLHLNTVSRKVSRLASKVKALTTAPA